MPAGTSDSALQGGAAAAATVAGPQATSLLDKVLLKQPCVREVLLPTPTNLNPIHIPGSDLLQFLAVQQWVAAKLGVRLPLLNGMFVLVPAASLQHSEADSSAACAAIPWRLRQVSAVELAHGQDPADATVVLVGGDRLRAGAVHMGLLADVQDHEYLCCEVAALQQAGRLRQLRVFDVAHMAWRMHTVCSMEVAIGVHEQEQAEMAAAGYEPELLQEAGKPGLEAIRNLIKKLPPPDWVQGQILAFCQLNPCVGPEAPEQQQQPLTAGVHMQLLEDAAAAWQQYVQCRLAGQQPLPVMQMVPGAPAPGSQLACEAAGAAGVAADAAGAAGAVTAAAATCSSDMRTAADDVLQQHSQAAPTQQAAHLAGSAAAPQTQQTPAAHQLVSQSQQWQQGLLSDGPAQGILVTPVQAVTAAAATDTVLGLRLAQQQLQQQQQEPHVQRVLFSPPPHMPDSAHAAAGEDLQQSSSQAQQSSSQLQQQHSNSAASDSQPMHLQPQLQQQHCWLEAHTKQGQHEQEQWGAANTAVAAAMAAPAAQQAELQLVSSPKPQRPLLHGVGAGSMRQAADIGEAVPAPENTAATAHAAAAAASNSGNVSGSPCLTTDASPHAAQPGSAGPLRKRPCFGANVMQQLIPAPAQQQAAAGGSAQHRQQLPHHGPAGDATAGQLSGLFGAAEGPAVGSTSKRTFEVMAARALPSSKHNEQRTGTTAAAAAAASRPEPGQQQPWGGATSPAAAAAAAAAAGRGLVSGPLSATAGSNGANGLGMSARFQDSAAAGSILVLVDQWLQQLALLLRPAQHIWVYHFARTVPVPEAVLQHFGGLMPFVYNTQVLRFTGRRDHVCLVPEAHARLLAKAKAAGVQLRALGPVPERQGAGTSPGAALPGAVGRGWDRSVQAEFDAWLQQLALLLPLTEPATHISIAALQARLPVPPAVLDHYGGIVLFFKGMGGLHWNGPRDTFSLTTELHRQLLRRAGTGQPALEGARVSSDSGQQRGGDGRSAFDGWQQPPPPPRQPPPPPRQQQHQQELWQHQQLFQQQQQQSQQSRQQQQQQQQQQGIPVNVPPQVACEARAWLFNMASEVQPRQPPVSISMAQLMQQSPVPDSVVAHYGVLEDFVRAIPGLRGDEVTECVFLEYNFHSSLRLLPEARPRRSSLQVF